ncbi:MAG TPA: hypothetical protein VJ305_19820 [Streptosporangiaceae bacterium]|nr:hypothetical protein [Streptosporangiaceae bacterium]
MSGRSYHDPQTQGIKHVDYIFTVVPTGVTAAIGEGDPNQSFVTIQRGTSGMAGLTGVTGTYVITTKDPFQAIVGEFAGLQITGQAAGSWTVEFGQAVQNPVTNFGATQYTFQIPFTVFSSGTATDVPGGDLIFIHLRFRNSITLP